MADHLLKSINASTNLPWPLHESLDRDVKLPVFYGSDPITWVEKAELVFELYQTPEHQKVLWAMVCMEGQAFHWMHWKRSTEPDMDWATFRRALIKRYEERYRGSIIKQLCDLRQTRSVDVYIDEFVRLAPQLWGVSEEEYLGLFMKGLSPEIRTEVLVHHPTRVDEAMDLARDAENRNLNGEPRWWAPPFSSRRHPSFLSGGVAANYNPTSQSDRSRPPFWFWDRTPDKGVDGLGSIDKMVYEYLQQPSSRARERGVHRNEIVHKLKVSEEELTEALENLRSDGTVYCTIDDNHYKSACSF